jgi:hypothetical protein
MFVLRLRVEIPIKPNGFSTCPDSSKPAIRGQRLINKVSKKNKASCTTHEADES